MGSYGYVVCALQLVFAQPKHASGSRGATRNNNVAAARLGDMDPETT